jgi:phage terminase small subunit
MTSAADKTAKVQRGRPFKKGQSGNPDGRPVGSRNTTGNAMVLKSVRHERFAQQLAAGKSATEAYELAGYRGDRTAASRLSTNVNIRARVTQLQNVAAEETGVTIDTLICEAAEIQQKATDGRQYSAAIAALIAKAKLAGRWVERTEQNNTNVNYAVSDRSFSQQEWVEKHVIEH